MPGVARGRLTFTAEVWQWQGDGPWHFVTLPGDLADDIKASVAGRARGFGSVPVEATIGRTTWRTSLFPDKGSQSYLLPLKKSVREAEGIDEGSPVDVALTIRL